MEDSYRALHVHREDKPAVVLWSEDREAEIAFINHLSEGKLVRELLSCFSFLVVHISMESEPVLKKSVDPFRARVKQ